MNKKIRIFLLFLLSYIIFIPAINGFMKMLEKSFNVDLNTININPLNLFTVIFKNGIIFLTWIIINIIILLVIKNVLTTRANAKIEVEGINLRKKDRNIWYC